MVQYYYNIPDGEFVFSAAPETKYGIQVSHTIAGTAKSCVNFERSVSREGLILVCLSLRRFGAIVASRT